MLSRLRISQRLGLLLGVPIAATVIIGVPAAVDRIDQSRAAAAVVGSVADARVIASPIRELQQERLLSLAYLSSPSVPRSALLRQHSSTMGSLGRARAALAGPTAGQVQGQIDRLAGLDGIRSAVLARMAGPTEVWFAYGDSIAGLIDALDVTRQPDADGVGVRQTQVLDALLRANEQSSQASAALILAAIDPAAAAPLAQRAQLLGATFQDRIAGQAEPSLVALLNQAFTGPSSQQITRLLADVTAQRPVQDFGSSLSLAQHDADLRRLVQAHVERAIADGASQRAAGARTGAVVMVAVIAGLVLVIVVLGFAVARSVNRPLRRITVAASAIADLAGREMIRTSRADETDDRPPQLAALTIRSDDEIGELASAFNRVQATAALLMEQQVATRRNVATMFGNIAHRTRSLVSRQLAQIDELERNERDEQRLASLYRLDHLTARLRRSADSLLVIAGTPDDTRLSDPQTLAEVIRSAMAEVEGYQGVALGHIDRVMLTAAVAPDLTLLLAELLENATNFSPPGVLVEVSSVRTSAGDCVVRVVDHGIGMTPQRLEQENQRLWAAERVDVAPTRMLGLFVAGRIARRHGIGVRLLPTPTSGVTAEVSIPPQLHVPDQPGDGPPDRTAIPSGPAAATRRALTGPAPTGPSPTGPSPTAPALTGPSPTGPAPTSSAPTGPAPMPSERPVPLMGQPSVPLPVGSGSTSPGPGVAGAAGTGSWVALWGSGPTTTTHVNGSGPPSGDVTRGGLRRRERGRSLPMGTWPAPREVARPGQADPDAERAALDAFTQGEARAQAGGEAPGRHGLRRRQPGAHLGADLRRSLGPPRPAEPRPHPLIDAEAERAQMNGYIDGIARAEGPGRSSTNPWSR